MFGHLAEKTIKAVKINQEHVNILFRVLNLGKAIGETFNTLTIYARTTEKCNKSCTIITYSNYFPLLVTHYYIVVGMAEPHKNFKVSGIASFGLSFYSLVKYSLKLSVFGLIVPFHFSW